MATDNQRITELNTTTSAADADLIPVVVDPASAAQIKKITVANLLNRASGTLVVPTAAAPAQTTEGSVVWDSDDDKLTVGDGSSRKTLMNENLLTTRGDIIYRNATVPARLAIGTTGKYLKSDGTDPSWNYPPGYEYDYAQITSDATITATSAAGATTAITGAAVTYDGSTVILIEAFCPRFDLVGAAATAGYVSLWDGSTDLGVVAVIQNPTTSTLLLPFYVAYRLTPSAASHTYSLRAWKTNAGDTFVLRAGAGTASVALPAFLRSTRVSP